MVAMFARLPGHGADVVIACKVQARWARTVRHDKTGTLGHDTCCLVHNEE
jgi:hypothetical protein